MEPEWSEVRKDLAEVLKRHGIGNACAITEGLLASTLTEILINVQASVQIARTRERERLEDEVD